MRDYQAMRSVRQIMSDQMTGCVEKAPLGGPLFDTRGNAISDEVAQDLFLEGESIVAPAAGAGSYPDILERLLFPECEPFDQISSAGEWTLIAFDAQTWYPVFQSNCHPRPGFMYTMDRMCGHEDKNVLMGVLSQC